MSTYDNILLAYKDQHFRVTLSSSLNIN